MNLKSFVLIEKDERFLLIKEAALKWRGKWFLPGGEVNEGELPEEAARRETLEEAGCAIELTGIFYVKYRSGFFTKKLSVFYCAKILGDKIKETENKHSLGAKWFTYQELLKLPLRSNLIEIVEAYRHNREKMPVAHFKASYL